MGRYFVEELESPVVTFEIDGFGFDPAGGVGVALSCACPVGAGQALTPEYFIPPSSGTASNGKPIFSWDQAAAQLTRQGDTWSFVLGGAVTVTYAYRNTAPAQMPDDSSGFSQFNAQQIEFTEESLRLWADVANITFVRVNPSGYSNSASILFSNYSSGVSGAAAFAYGPSPGATGSGSVAGDVWVNVSQSANANPVFGDFGPQTLAHEIGHAIGLDHPGDYNGGSPTYAADASYWQDARMFTIMSYFGSSNTGGSLPMFSVGPQLHDIAAAQRLYGANMTTRTGDTTYGFNSNSGHQHTSITSATAGAVFAIWDAGGIDTLDLSGYDSASEIDLREESFSGAGPGNGGVGTIAIGNISIARGAVIENAIGGAGSDTIIGNAAANLLIGNGGSDSLTGGDGDDVLRGGADGDVLAGGAGLDTADYAGSGSGVTVDLSSGAGLGGDAAGDTLSAIEHLTGSGAGDNLTGSGAANILAGGAGDDLLSGAGGDDLLRGGPGNDALNGGGGIDKADYSTAPGAVSVDLQAGIIYDGEGGSDTLSAVEEIVGSGFADALAGDVGANVLRGGAGDDVITGRAGDDTLDGGAGLDLAVFSGSGGDVTVTIGNGVVIDEFNDLDLLVSIEGFATGAGNDTLNGSENDDILAGGAGGDALNGAGGIDTASYITAPSGVLVNLNDLSSNWTGDALNDSYSSIERVQGSNFNDVLLGLGSVALDGAGGDDVMYGDSAGSSYNGGSGADGVIGLGGNDTANLGGGNDYVYGGDGADTAFGDAGTDILLGENGDDTLNGGSDQDYLYGLADNDTLNGDGGVDVLIGDIGTDTLNGGTENDYLYGGSGNDTANGGDGADAFVMEGGDDIVNGDAGNDFVYAGNDNDTVNGGADTDVLLGEAGNDQIDGGAGVDYVFLGTGDDTYVIDRNVAGVNVDVLYDFTPGAGSADLLRLLNSGLTTLAQVQAAMTDTGNGYSILVLDADTQVWIIGVTPAQLTAGDLAYG